MQRRTLLAAVGGALSLAGCTSGGEPIGTGGGTDEPDDGTDEPDDLPDDCPKSQDLGVEWPDDLDASTVESFVEAYEHLYYRDVVVEYEPESSLDSYDLSGSVSDPPQETGDGWTLEYSGSGGVYRPTLLLGATTATPPDAADVVSVEEIDDEPLTETLEEAAETGEAEFHVDPPGEEVDRYVELLTGLSDDFGDLSGPGDSDTLYVDVDGTTVELSVTASNFHGDYWWTARYYVDEQVVRRTADEHTTPRDGELLECRERD